MSPPEKLRLVHASHGCVLIHFTRHTPSTSSTRTGAIIIIGISDKIDSAKYSKASFDDPAETFELQFGIQFDIAFAMLPNNQLRMHSSAQPIVLPHGQPVGTPNIRPGESRRRICGGLVQHPYDWRFRTGATISQAVAIFICVMLMASLVFHWAIDKDALFNSALMIVSWTATVVLLWNFFSSIMQERYDFFTRSKQESEMYRARQRLFVWELAYALFSTGILACSDSRRPGCTIGIAADAMLCGFAFAQWVFVLFEGHYVYKLNHEENTMLDVVQPRHGGQPVQRTVSNTHDREPLKCSTRRAEAFLEDLFRWIHTVLRFRICLHKSIPMDLKLQLIVALEPVVSEI
ncbi:hypothetical protein LA080_007161 [Diaporthe eres]|nr:hypothetical protein LA080_007161 [Diaporthe eres]